MRRRSWSVNVLRPDGGVGIGIGGAGGADGATWARIADSFDVMVEGAISRGVCEGTAALDRCWIEGGFAEGLVN